MAGAEDGNSIMSYKIFLVEDDEGYAFLLRRVLALVEPSCELVHFINPLRAIAVLEALPEGAGDGPNLIITDLNMPEMSGVAFVKWLRQSRHRTVPVVMLSSSLLASDIYGAYHAGVNSWIAKPKTFEEMKATLRSLLHYWREISAIWRAPEDRSGPRPPEG